MSARKNPLPYYRDHLALIEDMIASKEAAIIKQRQTIGQLLREGGDLTAETSAMRTNAEALRRLQSERFATLNLIDRYTREES